MKRLLIGAAALALATGTAAHAQTVSAPGGWPWFTNKKGSVPAEGGMTP